MTTDDASPPLARSILPPSDAALDATRAEKDVAAESEGDALPELLTASLLHALVDAHDWDSHNALVVRAVAHPLCTPLTARLAYERAELASFDPDVDVPEWKREAVQWRPDLLAALQARFPEVIAK